MEEIEPWCDWSVETILSDQGNISPIIGSSKNKLRGKKSKNRFDEIVLGTESEMRVNESLLDQLSPFSGRFTINDIELKEADFFPVDSPSPDAKNTNSQNFRGSEFTSDSSQTVNSYSDKTEAESSHKPLPPFHHFRLPPPPPPPHISRNAANIKFADDLVPVIRSDVVDSGLNAPFSRASTPPVKAKTHLTNCSSAPSAIPPFRAKGKNSRLFSRGRRATYDNPAVPESWISPQSALLTVLTRDLYPPASELVVPPPQGVVDLEKYYAVFLPKNLSDDYSKGIVETTKVSSIPNLLGRSASTESLHKDRLLPLLDDFFNCGDLEFSSKNVLLSSWNSSPEESSSEASRRSNNSTDIDDVGFYLASNSPPGSQQSHEKMNDSLIETRWVPYFGDPKGARLPSSVLSPFPTSKTSSSTSYENRSHSLSSPRGSESNSIKRSRSAEPTKIEERSEKAKKYLRVRFADSEGLDLAKSKAFRKTDVLEIPTRVLEPLRCGIEKGMPAVGVRHFFPRNFSLECRSKEEEEKLIKEKRVALSSVQITSDLVLGTVVVGNVSSDHKKTVFIRCTYNDWNSFVDIPAGHLSCDSMTAMSSFSFALGIPRDFVKGDVLEFAVGYTGMGRIYWDNNNGGNYVIECFARQCPLHSEDRSWISFI